MKEQDAMIAELQTRVKVNGGSIDTKPVESEVITTPPPKNPSKARLDCILENIMFDLTPSDGNASRNVSVNTTPEKAEAAPTITYTNTSTTPTLQLQGN